MTRSRPKSNLFVALSIVRHRDPDSKGRLTDSPCSFDLASAGTGGRYLSRDGRIVIECGSVTIPKYRTQA